MGDLKDEQSFTVPRRAIPNPGYIWIFPDNLRNISDDLGLIWADWCKDIGATPEEATALQPSHSPDALLYLVINGKLAWPLEAQENKTVIE